MNEPNLETQISSSELIEKNEIKTASEATNDDTASIEGNTQSGSESSEDSMDLDSLSKMEELNKRLEEKAKEVEDLRIKFKKDLEAFLDKQDREIVESELKKFMENDPGMARALDSPKGWQLILAAKKSGQLTPSTDPIIEHTPNVAQHFDLDRISELSDDPIKTGKLLLSISK